MTRRGAWAVGLFFIAAGIAPILGGLGLIGLAPTAGTPGWIAVCAGLMFVLAGLAAINGYAIAGGVGPDGNLLPGTPFGVLLAQHVLGLGITGLMTKTAGWIAFGPGERHFSMTIALPFFATRSGSGELSGRIAFGVATMLLVAMTIGLGWAGAQSLRRTWLASRPTRPSP